ncbi:MAG: hypothetical protein HY554_07645 [Elusimicrobia bacterium]|nr:hypothetical protein [Elusimicrobiota bacterium]
MLAALVASVAVGAYAQGKPEEKKAPTMKILSFTGQVQIKIGNEVIGVVPGGKIPDIPAGAEVIIVSGEAVMQSGDTVVKADAGTSFTFNTNDAGSVQIGGTGDKAISVTVGGSEAKIEKGTTVEVAVASEGKAEIKVTAGQASVTVNGQTQTVATGQTTTATTTPPTTTAGTTSGTTSDGTQTTTDSTTQTDTTTTADGGTTTDSGSTTDSGTSGGTTGGTTGGSTGGSDASREISLGVTCASPSAPGGC